MRSTSSRNWLGLGEAMVNHICLISPAPGTSANGTVAPALTTTKSALPPERSHLEPRADLTRGRSVAKPFSGPESCAQQTVLIIKSAPKIRFTLHPSRSVPASGKPAALRNRSVQEYDGEVSLGPGIFDSIECAVEAARRADERQMGQGLRHVPAMFPTAPELL